MITDLSNEYSLFNILKVCFYFLLVLLIYIISYFYTSSKSSDWLDSILKKSTTNFLSGQKFIFVGVICYSITSVCFLILLDFYNKKAKNPNMELPNTTVFSNIYPKELDSPLHFYLFPLMIILSNLGMIIGYNSKNLWTHVVFLYLAVLINLYLMLHYARTISINILLLLCPLLFWQIANIIIFSI